MDIKTSTAFWDSVSDIYSDNQMTRHEGDLELEYVISEAMKINNYQQKKFICLGVADGCRDPIEILKFLQLKGRLNDDTRIYCNDLSSQMLENCWIRMNEFPHLQAQASYVSGPIHKLRESDWGMPNTRKSLTLDRDIRAKFIVGVYNSEYIEDSLEIYKMESGILGSQFTITFLQMSPDGLNILPNKEELTFDITDYKNHLQTILSWKNLPRFVAYSIKTSNGFISHYYSVDGINDILKSVFLGQKIISNPIGNRYIISLVCNFYNDANTLITLINNVLGNIPWNSQQDSLATIRDLFINYQ